MRPDSRPHRLANARAPHSFAHGEDGPAGPGSRAHDEAIEQFYADPDGRRALFPALAAGAGAGGIGTPPRSRTRPRRRKPGF